VRRRFTTSWILLIVAVAGMVVLAVLAYRALEQDVEGFHEADRPALHWSAAQAEVELSKFVATLSRFVLGDPGVTQADVNMRFDILWSRSSDFESGVIGAALRAHDEPFGAIPRLRQMLRTYDGAVMRLAENDPETNRALVREFAGLQSQLRKLVVSVLNSELSRYEDVRESLRAGSQLTFLVWAAAIVLAALIVGIMLIDTRRYQRMVIETEDLANKAQAADRAKSRFLTMMSHELRTPMNGVLGLIQLAKQSGLTEAQTRLLEQAERAGGHMTGLLSDILDFSDLQTERLEIGHEAFEVRHLGAAVAELIEATARRNALDVTVTVAPGTPEWVVGDVSRLRQALSHFCAYFIEIVGVDDLELTLSHDGADLVCAIDIDAKAADRPGWQPEAIFGREAEEYGDFASDSLGPTIARGLISLMGGRIEMIRPEAQRARLVVRVPAEVKAPMRDCVRIEAATETTEMLVRAALGQSRWKVWEPKLDRARVAGILYEPTGRNDARQIKRLAVLHPGARLIALGHAQDGGAYDAVCALPLDPAALDKALSDKEKEAAIA